MEKIAEKSQFPRYEHLDSVRGIAAMLVAFYHSLRPFSEIPRDTGIIAVLNGHTAVLFFFILSGFVLSGSLNSRGEMNLKSLLGYWVRRFFRLYPLVAFAILFSAFTAIFYTTSQDWSPVAPWVAKMMELSKNLSGLREYLSCLALHVSYLNAPLWTIKVELVCSALLPFLLFTDKFFKRPMFSIPAIAILLFFYYQFGPENLSSTKYLVYFFLGYVAFKLMAFSARIPIMVSSILLVIFLCLILAANYWNLPQVYMTFSLFGLFCLLIPCRSLILNNLLKTQSMLFLGRVSFSFYALHWPIMLILLSLMQVYFDQNFLDHHPFFKGLLLFVASVGVALPLSALTERFIERPFNLLGHRISNFMLAMGDSKA
jgi:peptidoglycan/LPS O-acetylase OafA/YrhL